MATCNTPVGAGILNFLCSLDPDHDGPHASRDKPASIRARERWLKAQDAAKEAAALGQFQGPAQTTAERYTDGATPPPGAKRETKFFDTVQTRPGAVPESKTSGTGSPLSTSLPGPEPTKQREGDQPLPETSDRPFVQHAVIRDIEERIEVGVERYGTPLQPMNGRDTMLDAYEEALDLAVYLRSVRYERQEIQGRLQGALSVVGTLLDGVNVTREQLGQAYEQIESSILWAAGQ